MRYPIPATGIHYGLLHPSGTFCTMTSLMCQQPSVVNTLSGIVADVVTNDSRFPYPQGIFACKVRESDTLQTDWSIRRFCNHRAKFSFRPNLINLGCYVCSLFYIVLQFKIFSSDFLNTRLI